MDRQKTREFQKNIYFIDYAKAFDCVDHNKLENSSRDGNTRPPGTLSASWDICMQVRKQQLELDMEQGWFQIGKGVRQGSILSPCLFNLCAEYMWNAGLDETQAGIKIAGRNINNLIYADDTTLMAESKEKLKNLLMKVKEESEKVGLNIQKCWLKHSEMLAQHSEN